MQQVTLLDSMGNDLTVVNAARVSFNKLSDDFDRKDANLVRYLAEHNHWTPFSQVTYQVRIKAPIFVARQWFKHQIGITRNEVSRRYVSDAPEFFTPTLWREFAENKKQGSTSHAIADHEDVEGIYDDFIWHAEAVYRDLLNRGVCPEQARMVLPQSMMTEWVETGSLVSAARICGLRLDGHAQKEIQDLAQLFSDAVKDIAPVSWKHLVDGSS